MYIVYKIISDNFIPFPQNTLNDHKKWESIVEFCIDMNICETVKQTLPTDLTIWIILFLVALVYQLLVVQSFYKEEKLIEETNYSRLRSDLTSQIEQQDEEEFQNIDL